MFHRVDMFCLLHQKLLFGGISEVPTFLCRQPVSIFRDILRAHIENVLLILLTFFLPITRADHVVLFLLFFARTRSTSTDGVVRLWDARTSQCVRERRGHTKAILDFALLPSVRACSPPPTTGPRASLTFDNSRQKKCRRFSCDDCDREDSF